MPRTMKKIRATPISMKILLELDNQVRRFDVKGDLDAFRDVAPDALDSYVMRHEVDELVRQRLLRVHRYNASEIEDEDRMRDPQMCGTRWTVEVTPRLVAKLWPDRLAA